MCVHLYVCVIFVLDCINNFTLNLFNNLSPLTSEIMGKLSGTIDIEGGVNAIHSHFVESQVGGLLSSVLVVFCSCCFMLVYCVYELIMAFCSEVMFEY